MDEIFSRLHECLCAGSDAVLVTVVASSGSTPRGAGARMLVVPGEKAIGTIGGGMVEYKSEMLAREALAENRSFLQSFKLTKNEVADLGMICGGDVDVYFQYFSHLDSIDIVKEITEAFERGGESFLTTEFDENGWKMYLGKPVTKEQGKSYYTDTLVSAGRVILFGGGHVSQKLSPILKHIGFKHIIADDREEFCCGSVFKDADDTVITDLSNISKTISISSDDYIVIMTRGHLLDYDVLVQALKTKARYIGMIGSRKKISKTYERLYTVGFTKEDTDRIHAPIGIEIMAETPEEISISIAAELIKVRAERNT